MIAKHIKEAYNMMSVEKVTLITSILISGAGLRFIANDVIDNCDIDFNSALARSIVVFSFSIVNTKNVLASLVFTLLYNIIRDIFIGQGRVCDGRKKKVVVEEED